MLSCFSVNLKTVKIVSINEPLQLVGVFVAASLPRDNNVKPLPTCWDKPRPAF